MMKLWKRLIPLGLALVLLLTGCAQAGAPAASGGVNEEDIYLDRVSVEEIEMRRWLWPAPPPR